MAPPGATRGPCRGRCHRAGPAYGFPAKSASSRWLAAPRPFSVAPSSSLSARALRRPAQSHSVLTVVRDERCVAGRSLGRTQAVAPRGPGRRPVPGRLCPGTASGGRPPAEEAGACRGGKSVRPSLDAPALPGLRPGKGAVSMRRYRAVPPATLKAPNNRATSARGVELSGRALAPRQS